MSEEPDALGLVTEWCGVYEDVEDDEAEDIFMNAINADAEIMEIVTAIVSEKRGLES